MFKLLLQVLSVAAIVVDIIIAHAKVAIVIYVIRQCIIDIGTRDVIVSSRDEEVHVKVELLLLLLLLLNQGKFKFSLLLSQLLIENFGLGFLNFIFQGRLKGL